MQFWSTTKQERVNFDLGVEVDGARINTNTWMAMPEDARASIRATLGLEDIIVDDKPATIDVAGVPLEVNEKNCWIDQVADGKLTHWDIKPKSVEMRAQMVSDDIEARLVKVRAVREQIIDRLMGISGRESRKGNAAASAACDAAAEALLDLTTDVATQTTLAAAEALVVSRYAVIVNALKTNPDAAVALTAFYKLDL